MPEKRSLDDLRDHLVWRGVRPPGQVRHLRQGPQLHHLDTADHRHRGEESTPEQQLIEFNRRLFFAYTPAPL